MNMNLKLSNRSKQMFLIVLCVLVYASVYVARYSYGANIGAVMSAYGVTRAEAGLVSTFFFFSYGASQVVHSFLCRFYPRKYIVPIALLAMAAINLAMFFEPPFAVFKYLWMLNGMVTSLLWPTIVLVWGETLDGDMMPRATFLISLALPIGTVIAYGGSAIFNLFSFWRGAFLMGGTLPLVFSVLWFTLYDYLVSGRDPSHAAVSAETKSSDAQAERRKTRWGAEMIKLVVLCVCLNAAICFVRDGLSTWTPVLLGEQFGLSDSNSIVLTLVLPIFGIFGSALAIRMNRLIRDFRSLSCLFCFLMSACLAVLLLILNSNWVILALVLLGSTSCLIHGATTVLITIMPLSIRDRVNPGVLSGIINASAYIGSTVSAYGLGSVADTLGWHSVVRILLFSALGSTVLAGGAMLVNALCRNKNENGSAVS